MRRHLPHLEGGHASCVFVAPPGRCTPPPTPRELPAPRGPGADQEPTMKIERLNGLFQEQVKDLHSSESQILATLPDMIEAASDSDLRDALSIHLEETRTH